MERMVTCVTSNSGVRTCLAWWPNGQGHISPPANTKLGLKGTFQNITIMVAIQNYVCTKATIKIHHWKTLPQLWVKRKNVGKWKFCKKIWEEFAIRTAEGI